MKRRASPKETVEESKGDARPNASMRDDQGVCLALARRIVEKALAQNLSLPDAIVLVLAEEQAEHDETAPPSDEDGAARGGLLRG